MIQKKIKTVQNSIEWKINFLPSDATMHTRALKMKYACTCIYIVIFLNEEMFKQIF